MRDANDTAAVKQALELFRRTGDRPTLIIVDSIIGYGAPHKQNTAAAHSDPLGEEEARLAKRVYGWPEDAQFWCRTAYTSAFATASVGAAARCVTNG